MSHPNPDTDERVRQIRQRLVAHKTEAAMYRNHEWARGDALHYREAPSDVDYLLSLLDSQAAELVKTKQHRDDLIEELNRR